MKAADRQSLMYDYIKKHSVVSIHHIAKYFDISPVTVRRYLDKLEKNGLIRREYGKAVIADKSKAEYSFYSRALNNPEHKQAIAHLALPYLLNVSSAFFDASTTALALLKLLPKNHAMTIYASNTAVFNYLEDYPNIRLFILGGYLSKTDRITLDSEITLNVAKQIFVEASFISCGGFSDNGFFDNATTGIAVKRMILQNSEHNYLLVDHTKFNSSGIFLVDTWEPIHTIICDSSFNKLSEKVLKDKGIQLKLGTR